MPAVIAADVYIRQGPEHQHVRAGAAVTFHCSFGTDSLLRGTPTVQWQKNGRHIQEDARVKVNPSDFSLTISNTKGQDSGTYTCVGKQRGESDSASAQLQVDGKDQMDKQL